MEQSAESFAVVTGASQGLGKAFAEELAERNIPVILVSLPEQGLEDLSLSLSEAYGVQAPWYETDLSSVDNVMALAEWINQNFRVHILINNAGIGGSKRFLEAGFHYLNRIMQVNVVATSILTHQLLPDLMKRPQSYILNVSSMAAFSPSGYKTVYPASKSFIHSFSRGLYEELKGSNVFVSVVHPGPIRTSREIISRIEKQGWVGRLTALKPEKVAKYCIQQLFKKDTVIMVNPVSWMVMNLLPVWIKLPLMTRAVKKNELQP